MRTLGAALLALMLSVPAMAQTAREPKSAEINPVQIYNEQNEQLGVASEVVVNAAGNVQGVVIKVNDTGSPSKEVVLPLDRVKDTKANKRIVVAATKDELKALPALQETVPDTRAGQT